MPAESAAADPNSHPPHRKGKRPKTETAPIWADCMITGQYLERDVRLENRRIFQVSSEANFRLSAFVGKIGFRLLSEKRPAPPRSFFAIFFVLLLQLHNSISHTVCARFCCASKVSQMKDWWCNQRLERISDLISGLPGASLSHTVSSLTIS